MLSNGEKQQILFNIAYFTHWLADSEEGCLRIIVREWQNGEISSEERDFKLLCLDKLKEMRDQLLSPQPDATDIWRENLKEWNLKQREVLTDKKLDVEKFKIDISNPRTVLRPHYKGEF